MLRDTMLWISEMLFYVQGGEMLINTPWIFVWVVFWSLVIASPMFYAINVRPTNLAPLAFLIMFFPGLLLATGPGIVQAQMMQECKTIETVVESDQVESTVMEFQECRVKDNYYGDFGTWQLRK